MNVLVIGGCGYIGSILVPELLKCNHKVHVLDNLKYQQTSLIDVCHDKHLSITRGDCRDKVLTSSVVAHSDVVILLAAIVGTKQCDLYPYEAITTNVEAAINLTKCMSPNQILLYPCTNSGYGIGQDDVFCTEETALNPISLYGRTKVEAENHILEHGNSISLRLATVFGASPSMRTDLLVNHYVLQAVRSKSIVLFESEFKRNYIHIRDVAQSFLLCINNFDTMRNNIYNVGLSDANLSKKELCAKISEYTELSVTECEFSKDDDQRNYIVSNQKIEKCGFVPQFTVDDGIQELIKVYTISDSYYF